MKVYISADIEGCTGVVSWAQCGRPNGEHFDFAFARRMMTHDVNAAIRGARRAGAEKIVVKDSHGNSKNLLIDELEPGVELVSGFGARMDGMMVGLDDSFDACMLIGYHGMAGTRAGLMEHTISGRPHRIWINERPIGEIGVSALTAGSMGVPLVTISSDQAGCAEGAALIPGISVAETKVGFGRYMAQLAHPSETGPRIEAAAEAGLRSGAPPLRWDGPFEVKVEFNRTEEADLVERLPGASRLDGYAVARTSTTWDDAHRGLWCMIYLAEAGAQAQQ